jgi:arginyl-tRNA synthetase
VNLYASLAAPILAAYPDLDEADLSFQPAPKLDVGDVALRLFEAARKLQMPPPKLAATIAHDVAFGPEVLEIIAAGPYLNFKLNRGMFAQQVVNAALIEGDRFGSNASGAGKSVLIEHTSINPNASPHVGRGRNAMIGDSLARMLRFEGYDVSVHYYVNDMGRQIGLLVLSCPDPGAMNFDQILDTYVQANARAEADPAFAAEGYAQLSKMEEGDPATRAKFHAVTDLCLNGQLGVLERLGAHYDVFDRESDFVKDARLDRVVEALKAKEAVFIDEDQRLVVDLAKLGFEREEGRFFVLMRANGSSMYGYRDLAYTIYKSEQGADLDLMVLGEDHKLYAEQVALILAQVGIEAPEPVHYAYILLKDGKMSTRQGKVVLLSDFLDQAEALALERVRAQCTELDDAECQAIAAKVAVSAIRFTILRVSPNKNVTFDWESSLSFTGDTGPYVQYSCARISSILRKFGEVPAVVQGVFPVEGDAEWALLTKIASFRDTVSGAMAQRNCAPIAQFALDVAHLFTTFYHECPVLQAQTPALRIARAQICAATRQTLVNALNLLGIEALEKM